MADLTAIYVLECPDGNVRYVGKSKNPKSRMESHVTPGRRSKTPVAQWCRSLKAKGKRPVMRILEWVEDWSAAERRWISHYRENGARLLNIAAGGYDAAHLTVARGRMPAYDWAMKFCGRRKNDELAEILRSKAEIAKTLGPAEMRRFDNALWFAVFEGCPMKAFRIPRCQV